MRVFHLGAEGCVELGALPAELPPAGFLWIGSSRAEFETGAAALQARLQHWTGSPLVDLHVSDLLNAQLPSHFDSTPWYDRMVFRRLALGAGAEPLLSGPAGVTLAGTQRTLESIDTSAVGFAVYDRVLLSVHPADCSVLDYFAQRLLQWAAGGDSRAAARLPVQPADLMLRMVNHMVDGYLELRRVLTRQLGTLEGELLDTRSRFADWPALLESRNRLHQLEDTCEDQRSAIQEWIDSLGEWPAASDLAAQRERELLRLRSRDVLEHIERVLTHVRRLEHSAEAAVQMHFSALSHRTNDIMRTLTVLTAIFLPLNLITGFFGMNFDSLPLIHSAAGIWTLVALMAAVGVGLVLYFRRKRYLESRPRP
jgi:Mg2+ and Co2+ transporter CorA